LNDCIVIETWYLEECLGHALFENFIN